MTKPVRLGMLTPSSNTTLEPVTYRMMAGLPEVSAHFGRFKVTEIALTDSALGQFDDSEILRAAELLAHAKVDCIAWNGTSAAWLGFDRDERLVERITAATGIKACTTVLSYRDLFRRAGHQRIGLVTPYIDDVQAQIISNWAAAGFDVTAERHLKIQDNFAFAEVTEATTERLVRDVAAREVDCVAIVCTNVNGAAVAAKLESELGLPILDSVAVTLWASLRTAGIDPARVQGWGQVFASGGV